MRPRILQVLHSFGIGGSEIFALELARQLTEQGAEVLCGALESAPGPLLQRCQQYGIQVVDLKIPQRHPLGRNGLSPALVRRLRALRLDAVHLQHFVALNKLGLPARLAGIPHIVVTEHSVFDVAQSRAGRLRARLNWRLATAITVIHQSIKDYLCKEIGVAAGRVAVIPLGIEIARYHRRDRDECRARLGLRDELVFAFVGRVAPVKDVPGLIAAFVAAQAPRQRATRLIVVGDGECRAQCEALIRTLRCQEHVTLLGAQPDARPCVAAADVFVLNSRSEGTPRALLEAMAMGIPGICPAVGGIPDILQGRGWLTRPGDPASLQAAMGLVMDDPARASALDAPCRDYIRSHFDDSRIAGRYQKLLLG
jgi:glycosyltransferase involved in cell wall biosynthesis